jgi:hypothetical protein
MVHWILLQFTHYFGHPSDPFTTCVHVPKRAFLHEKSDWLSLLKNPIKEDRRRLHYTQGAAMPDRRPLP